MYLLQTVKGRVFVTQREDGASATKWVDHVNSTHGLVWVSCYEFGVESVLVVPKTESSRFGPL